MLGSDNYTVKDNDFNKIDEGLKRISIDIPSSVIPTNAEDEENTNLKVSYSLKFYRIFIPEAKFKRIIHPK